LVITALQHVALISNSLVYPVILAREAGLSPERIIDFVALSMAILGLSTVLLCMRTAAIGSGYLVPAGFTQIYLGPSLFAVHTGGLPLVSAMTFFAGSLQLIMAPALRRMRVVLPPEIAGLVIAVVGLSIAVLGVRYGLGITANHGVQPIHMLIAGISLAIMIVFNVWSTGYLRMFCALIGIAVGYATSAALGTLDFSSVIPPQGVGLFRLPTVQLPEWRFAPGLIAPFAVVALAATLSLMGNVSTAQRVNDADWVRPNFRSLSAGLAGGGLASMLCGLVGSLGVNTYSPSIGLSTATGITSRSVGYVIGAIFAVLAVLPPAAILVASIPSPVVGAALFFTAAFVFTSGLQMITARLLDSRKIIVIGFSFAMAVMADIYHDVFSNAPLVLRPIFDSSLVLGTVCAVVLNLIMRIGVRKQVSVKLQPGDARPETVEQFMSEQGAHWGARRDVMQRAIFGVVQSLEVLGDLPGAAVIDASFDEYNLDVRIRYAGPVLVIPERRPSTKQILASEEGERLLAGYLLRRSADRISCRSLTKESEIHLHYDH
jgi:NCS2 family nucleobase:cation symporter-2